MSIDDARRELLLRKFHERLDGDFLLFGDRDRIGLNDANARHLAVWATDAVAPLVAQWQPLDPAESADAAGTSGGGTVTDRLLAADQAVVKAQNARLDRFASRLSAIEARDRRLEQQLAAADAELRRRQVERPPVKGDEHFHYLFGRRLSFVFAVAFVVMACLFIAGTVAEWVTS